jgi:hypothetical protein
MTHKMIRTGVFETNSSSCHTITISHVDNDTLYQSITPNDNGEIVIAPQEFGWEWETYNNPESKLCYVMLYIRDWVHDQATKDAFSDILNRVVLTHTHATKLTMGPSSSKYWNGYIDHQSVEDNDCHHLFDSDEKLKDFIFGPQSSLNTGNDNDYE